MYLHSLVSYRNAITQIVSAKTYCVSDVIFFFLISVIPTEVFPEQSK